MSETTTIEISKATSPRVIRRELKAQRENNIQEFSQKLQSGEIKHDPRLEKWGLSDWKRSLPYRDDFFALDKYDEPHNKRKRQMLEKYPQIRELYGYTNLTLYYTIFVIIIQFITSYYVNYLNVYWMLLVAYVVGGTIGSICGIVLHECTHDLAGKRSITNSICGYLANSIMVIPVYISFRRYHLDHHAFQGVLDKDPDLPRPWEIPLIKGNPIAKCIWLFFFPALYLLRGVYCPKPITIHEVYNWTFMIAVDLIVYYFCGWYSLAYLIISTWFSFGIHPAATHFIQEHYTFDDGQETYSYYGSGNYIFLNIGYHNEHHDFAHIPWTNLPKLKKLAGPYYDNMRAHHSWFKVLFEFLFTTNFGPQSRIVRTHEVFKIARRIF